MPEAEPIRLRVDGREVVVATATSVAAMLLSHIELGGQPLCGMGTCFACSVEIDGRPHQRGCLVLCRASMEVHTRG